MLSELDNYLERIEDLRGQVCELIAELPAEALNWRPIPPFPPPRACPERSRRERGGQTGGATNSLAVLATHVAGAEHFWIGEVVGGRPPTRDRDAEFVTEAAGAAELLRLLEQVGAETQGVFATLDATALDGTRQARDRTIPVRWCILHVIDHTALHLGHMQLTYQLWRGGQGVPAPRWFERLANR
jgi:uncharacterized damage-inducible protein DinB